MTCYWCNVDITPCYRAYHEDKDNVRRGEYGKATCARWRHLDTNEHACTMVKGDKMWVAEVYGMPSAYPAPAWR